jgi:hypothetical protein
MQNRGKSMTSLTILSTSLLLAAAPTAGDGRPILDETAYCRAYVQFACDRLSPGGLARDGKTVLGPRGMAGLKRTVQRRLGADFDEKRWMNEVYTSFQWLQYGGSRDAANLILGNDPPPPDWTTPASGTTAFW